MNIIEIVAVVAHIASLFACVAILAQGDNRSEDKAVMAGIAFSSATFIVMMTIRVLAVSEKIAIEQSAYSSLVGGFFILNGIIFLSVAAALKRHKERRTNP